MINLAASVVWMSVLAGLTATSWVWLHAGPARVIVGPLGLVFSILGAAMLPFFELDRGRGEAFDTKAILLLSWPYTLLVLRAQTEPSLGNDDPPNALDF